MRGKGAGATMAGVTTDDYTAWDRMFTPERRAVAYEGLTREQAEAKARNEAVGSLRIADWDLPGSDVFTADFRPGRLNLLIHHGRVARAGFG